MTLLEFKWLAAAIILAITLLTGLASIAFANRYQKQLEVGDAIANGIFIGAAIFHLFPTALQEFRHMGLHFLYAETIALIAFSFAVLWLLEYVLLRRNKKASRQVKVWVLTIALSIHALIAGVALGISTELSIVSILFIAIIAHKGFETFAFVVNLHRQLGKVFQVILVLLVFSLVTPVGIALGIFSDTFLYVPLDNLLTALFSAFAAGTFLYIGTVHSHHLHHTHEKDNYHQYVKVIATIIGVAVMGVISIWV